MEINGLMLVAFKVFAGNPTILGGLVSWAVFLALLFTVIEVSKGTEL